MLIILSPAKTMNMSRTGHMPQGTSSLFDTDALFLAEKMKRYSVGELSKILKISKSLAEVNYMRYQHFTDVDAPSKAALFAYDGSVFKAIAPDDFTESDLAYAQNRLRIISTLYGLVRPLDLIKAYRIAFNLKLDGVSGNLYDYWHSKLTKPLIADVEKVGGVLVNLASLDIQASLDMEKIKKELTVITPEFKEIKHGKYEVIRTYAKIARGAMTRFIIKERVETVEGLKRFEWKGYKFNASLSDEVNYIYTREINE